MPAAKRTDDAIPSVSDASVSRRFRWLGVLGFVSLALYLAVALLSFPVSLRHTGVGTAVASGSIFANRCVSHLLAGTPAGGRFAKNSASWPDCLSVCTCVSRGPSVFRADPGNRYLPLRLGRYRRKSRHQSISVQPRASGSRFR